MNKLEKYGLKKSFSLEASNYPELTLARVTSQHKSLYNIVTLHGDSLAEVSGKFRFNTLNLSDFPVVGDFIMCDLQHKDNGFAVIQKVLTRKSIFARISVSNTNQTQIIAANIDIVFICMSLNNNFNLSRLERYLSAAWDSGAVPVVVLTKSDLCHDIASALSDVSKVAIGADILTTSSYEKDSYQKLLTYLKHGVTASFIGSSGVGKSTLINCLLEKDLLATSEIRNDDKGRHTTTRREIISLSCGAVVIDTPGMREFGVESVDLSYSFSDIEELEKKCRFSDCRHSGEPGCAINNAIENGDLDIRRLKSYLKLQNEARYSGLNAKQIEVEKLNRMFSKVGGMKKVKKYIKEHKKNKYNKK